MTKYTEAEIAKADGPFIAPEEFTSAYLQAAIDRIDQFPIDLVRVVNAMKPEWQDLPYRTGGWKLKQVIHHIADSHMQAFSRFKLSLTEDAPIVKPYIQNAWAVTADSELADIQLSVNIIQPLHKRLVILLRNMKESDFDRTYIHPEYQKTYTLSHVVGLYAWHGHHHLQQVEMFMENMQTAQSG